MQEPWKYKTARDAGLSLDQRLKSVHREPGLFSYLAHHAAMIGLRTYLTLWHRLRIVGSASLPRSTPFVIIANHASHIDALVLASALPASARAAAFPVAAGDAFFTSTILSGFSATFINALPLWRKKVTTHAMQDLRERLLHGDTGLILFPEGARTRDGQPLPYKAGLGMLVAGTDIPVVACYLHGTFEAFPPGTKMPRPVRLTLTVGPVLNFAEVPNDRAGWETVAARAREAILSLR
jgi:1-acyl-sn-glycerol-3-phosphate acyltransferase